MIRRQERRAGERDECIVTGIDDGVVSDDMDGRMRDAGSDRGFDLARIVPD